MQHCRNKYNKDQGNVRAVINEQGVLEEINHYYPYGGLAGSATAGVQPLKLESKELDRENGLDLYDFQTRQQDPASTLFTTQDPLCEQNFSCLYENGCDSITIRSYAADLNNSILTDVSLRKKFLNKKAIGITSVITLLAKLNFKTKDFKIYS